jgi:methylated-DNA-protein-cysteine methyltransferase-like protein
MGAGIVPITIRRFRNPGDLNCGKKERPMATAKNKKGGKKGGGAKKTATRKSATEKLAVLKPSGRKDDSFFDQVHEVARQVPRGRVTSYGAIAACLGTRLSARMVGWAMNVSGSARKPVPAHRVVNSQGLLTGRHHFNPPERMQELLEKEGIEVKNERVVEFAKVFWDPAAEL